MPLASDTAPPPPAGKTEADRYYLKLALQQRIDSDDPKSRYVLQSGVGALIVRNGEIVAQSANVLPPALKVHFHRQDLTIAEEQRYHVIEHAERAAIFKALLAGRELQNATIYCSRFPCSDCARAIVWVGIKRAVFGSSYAGEARWIESQKAALHILRRAGITVRVLPPLQG